MFCLFIVVGVCVFVRLRVFESVVLVVWKLLLSLYNCVYIFALVGCWLVLFWVCWVVVVWFFLLFVLDCTCFWLDLFDYCFWDLFVISLFYVSCCLMVVLFVVYFCFVVTFGISLLLWWLWFIRCLMLVVVLVSVLMFCIVVFNCFVWFVVFCLVCFYFDFRLVYFDIAWLCVCVVLLLGVIGLLFNCRFVDCMMFAFCVVT